MRRPNENGTFEVPEWMVQFGIKKSEWLDLSKAQLRTMQLPGKSLKVRVWATGMLHSSGYKTQQATTMRGGKKVPLTSTDIITELWNVAKQYFTKAGIQGTDKQWLEWKETKEEVRQVLSELEREGVAERTDTKGTPVRNLSPEQSRRLPSGRTLMFFWLIPRPPNAEDVAREWDRRQPAIPPEDPNSPPDDGDGNPEVGKNPLPLPPIWQILKVFQIEPPEKAQMSDPDYQKRVERARVAARKVFIEVVNEPLPQVAEKSPREVGTTGGAFESKAESNQVERAQRPPASPVSAVSSSSISKDAKKNTSSVPSLRDDDEKPKPEEEEIAYATARDELIAIYFAKTGEYPTMQLLNRLESMLWAKGKTFDDYLPLVKGHLGGTWNIPAAILTHLAKTGFEPQVSPPRLKPKPKCPTCYSDNQRGAILLNGAIVPCPACSTAEWRKEMEVKLTRPALKTRGAAND